MSEASVTKFLADLGGVIVGFAALMTLVAVFGKPLLVRMWVWQMKEARVDLKDELDRLYQERIAKINEALATVDDLTGRFEMLFESQKRQGEAMIEQNRETARANAEALDKISKTLESIHEESAETARAVSHLYGLMQKDNPWDGTERRRRPRG